MAPELCWLPEPPSDWAEQLLALPDGASAESWARLVSLANHRLDGLATIRLDRRMKRLFGDAPPPGLAAAPIRLAVLASSTVEHVLPAIRVAALRRGLWLATYTNPYGQYAAELLDPGSGLYRFRPTAILFALDAHHLLAGLDSGGAAEAAEQFLDRQMAELAGHWRRARAAFGCTVLQQTALPVFPRLFGNNEHRLPGSAAAGVAALNARLRAGADAGEVDLVALECQAALDGLGAWYDPVLWHKAKQAVHPAAAPVYGDLVARLLAAQNGVISKCLVLDLDNTLWGGVIGDDGTDGILLGQGSALGEAFAAFQTYARDLSRRGVILAVCSKNDEAIALAPFEHHPEMVLKRSDIACFVANWSDKAGNLRVIAERLNIGLESLVFADDNPFERNIVRRELPMVAVPELPADPAFYASCIASAGYFEGVRLTAEDALRTSQYQANAARATIRDSATDMDGYLRSLDMTLHWRRFDTAGQARIVQLINKTNQFNLTTRRSTAEDVAAVIADPAALSLQIRLTDRFGDNGIIAIVIGRFEAPGAATILIETWLMSCRVLGRQVEAATLDLVVAEARRLGATGLIGQYRPSAKNAMVQDHYARLGFAPHADDGSYTSWFLALDAHQPKPHFIKIIEG